MLTPQDHEEPDQVTAVRWYCSIASCC